MPLSLLIHLVYSIKSFMSWSSFFSVSAALTSLF
jgi:hypothetical protein